MARSSRFGSLAIALVAFGALLMPAVTQANPVATSVGTLSNLEDPEHIRPAFIGGTVVTFDRSTDRPVPVAGARVELVTRDGTVVQTVRSNDEGHFRFDRTRPGHYIVRAAKPDVGRGMVRLNALPGRNLVRVPIR